MYWGPLPYVKGPVTPASFLWVAWNLTLKSPVTYTGLGFRGLRVLDLGFNDFGFKVLGLRFKLLDLRFIGSGFKV